MKPNRITSAGTKADNSTTDDCTSVSQTIAKPNVGCCLFSGCCQTTSVKESFIAYADTGHYMLSIGITHINNIPVIQNSSLNE